MGHVISLPTFLSAAVLASCPFDVQAGEPARPQSPQSATVTVERHATSNALDSDLELFDWYSQLRGALQQEVVLGETKLTFGAAGEARIYDTYKIEDDATLTLTAQADRKIGKRLELRGTLSYTIVTEGDDFAVGDVVIGIRTATQTYRAGLEAGIDLGHGFTLALGGTASREAPQPTRFEDDLADPLLFAPATDRQGLSARLAHGSGNWSAGAALAAEWVQAGQPGEPPYDFRLEHQTAQIEGAWTAKSGLTVKAAFGGERLTALDGAISQTRPTYAFSIDAPFQGGLELRAAINAGFDTTNGDDPVASWLRRLEFEAGVPVAYKIKLAAGLYSLQRENLSLLTVERAQGIYAEASRPFGGHLAAVVRVDAENSRIYATGFKKQTIDVYVGLTGKI